MTELALTPVVTKGGQPDAQVTAQATNRLSDEQLTWLREYSDRLGDTLKVGERGAA
jgi:hypothetical protein